MDATRGDCPGDGCDWSRLDRDELWLAWCSGEGVAAGGSWGDWSCPGRTNGDAAAGDVADVTDGDDVAEVGVGWEEAGAEGVE